MSNKDQKKARIFLRDKSKRSSRNVLVEILWRMVY